MKRVLHGQSGVCCLLKAREKKMTTSIMCCNSTVEWTRYHSIPIAVAVELCRYWLLRYLLWYSSTLHVLDKELFLSMHSLDVCWPKKTVKSLHCSHACVCSGGNRCVGFVSHDLCAHLCLFLCVFCPPPPPPPVRGSRCLQHLARLSGAGVYADGM